MGFLDRLFPKKQWPDGREMSSAEESAHWMATCPECGSRRSIADYGGTRYRAQGSPTKPLPCTPCGATRRMKVVWQPPARA